MRQTLRSVLVFSVCLGSLIAVVSCSKKSTSHQPVRYRLYAGAWEPIDRSEVFVIDAEADSVLDSMDYPGSIGQVVASPDGEYFAAGSGDTCTRVYDPRTLTMLAELPCRLRPVFVPDDGLILGFGRHTMKAFDYSSLALLYEDSMRLSYPQLLTNQALIYGVIPFGETRTDSTGFAVYDYRNRRIARLWTQLRRSQGGSYGIIYEFHAHPDGSRIYGLGGGVLFGYDLFAESTLFEVPTYSFRGSVRLSPDCREVYLTDPGFSFDPYTPGKIFIYDADNGAPLNEISLLDLDTSKSGPRPLYAWEICFHPVLPRVYVGCGGQTTYGPILVIDTKAHRIVKWILPNFDHAIQSIDIAPSP